MQHYRIASVIFTKFLMNRIRIDAMEEVQSAYKNDQGIILHRPEAFTRVRFVIPYWLIPEILRRWHRCCRWKTFSTAYSDL